MTYSQGHPIRLIGGRLALDFVNTADWSEDGEIRHEKIGSEEDLSAWVDALQLGDLVSDWTIAEFQAYRAKLRDLLNHSGDASALNALQDIDISAGSAPGDLANGQPLESLLAVSALSILVDPREWRRIKMCPGENCGWLFLDETKNGRRSWCSMALCGNRAKAARHYARSKVSA